MAQRFVHPSNNRALHWSHTLHVQGIPDFFIFSQCFQVHLVGVRGVASKDDRRLNNKNNPTYLEEMVGSLIEQLLM